MTDLGLLAPVPFEHLVSGAEVCEREGKVAFGSMAWELFRDLDRARAGAVVPVYLYASWADPLPRIVITWRATYIGHVEGTPLGHPSGMRFRPPTTGKYEGDNSEWAVYWEVRDLAPIPEGPERLRLGTFTGHGRTKPYGTDFVPEGPIIVRAR